jgi:hypothetical protein
MGSILSFKPNDTLDVLKIRSNQKHNIKFIEAKVNLIQLCSLNPNYIARKIVSNVLEGDMVKFVPLDGNEFGVLM